MTIEQSDSQTYSGTHFDYEKIIEGLPAELKTVTTEFPPIISYSPLRLELPKATSRDLITRDKNNEPKGLNRNNLIPFLEDNLIIAVGNDFRQFDGRRYAPISVKQLKKFVSKSVHANGLVPRNSDVEDFIKMCWDLLEREINLPPNMKDYDKYCDQPFVAFQNGLFNLDTHEMMPFTPFLPIFHYIRANFDPTVEDAPARAILEDIIPDAQTRDFLFEMIGYILFEPTMNPPAIFVLYGPTQTGKSAIATVIENLIGLDSTTHMNMKQLTAQFGPADLEGKLLNVCKEAGGESAVNTKFDGELLKNMTSGEIITVEKKYRDAHEIIPTAKTLFCTNSPPDFGDDSSGLLRRLFIIPCRQPQNPKDKIYNALMTPQSMSYIVTKAYRAYLSFKAKGDFSPSPLMEREKRFYKSQNSILDFLQTTFNTDKRDEIRNKLVSDPELCYTAVLHQRYVEFCNFTLSRPVGRKRFVEYIRNEYNLEIKNEGIYFDVDGIKKHTTRDRYVKAGVC